MRTAFARCFAPLLLTGCTVISGAASLSVGGEGDSSDSITSGGSQDSGGAATSVVTAPTAEAGTSHNSSPPPIDDEDDAGTSGDPVPPTDAGPPVSDSSVGSSDSSAPPIDAGPPPPPPVTVTFTKSLLEDQQQTYGPYKAKAGTPFDVRTTGSGDPDLFLRFNQPATVDDNDCASDFDGANEHCRRTVPNAGGSGGANGYVLIDAWEDCSYTITITYTPQ